MISDTAGIILAGGSGERMGTSLPKQFLSLGSARVIDYSVQSFLAQLAQVIVVIPDISVAAEISDDARVVVVQGGATRTDSVQSGLSKVAFPYVLVHDAARPFVEEGLVQAVRDGLDRHAAVCPVLPVTNTIVVDHGGTLADTPDRAEFREVQTPQGFQTASLRAALTTLGDDHSHLPELVRRMGHPVLHVPGSPWLFKITYEPSIYAARRYVDGGREPLRGQGRDDEL